MEWETAKRGSRADCSREREGREKESARSGMAAMMSGFMRLRHSSTASSSLRASSSLWSFVCDPNSQVQQCFRLFSSGSESEPTSVEPPHRISHTDVSTLDDVLAPVTVVEVPVATSAAADHVASPDESVLEIQEVLDTPARPRVAPLPEDLSPEALEAQSHVAEAVKEKLKPSIPLPSFGRNQQRNTRSDPLLLADAIRQVKVRTVLWQTHCFGFFLPLFTIFELPQITTARCRVFEVLGVLVWASAHAGKCKSKI